MLCDLLKADGISEHISKKCTSRVIYIRHLLLLLASDYNIYFYSLWYEGKCIEGIPKTLWYLKKIIQF
jgi:hypothetical protein